MNIDHRWFLAIALLCFGIVALRKMTGFSDVSFILWITGCLGLFFAGFVFGRITV